MTVPTRTRTERARVALAYSAAWGELVDRPAAEWDAALAVIHAVCDRRGLARGAAQRAHEGVVVGLPYEPAAAAVWHEGVQLALAMARLPVQG